MVRNEERLRQRAWWCRLRFAQCTLLVAGLVCAVGSRTPSLPFARPCLRRHPPTLGLARSQPSQIILTQVLPPNSLPESRRLTREVVLPQRQPASATWTRLPSQPSGSL